MLATFFDGAFTPTAGEVLHVVEARRLKLHPASPVNAARLAEAQQVSGTPPWLPSLQTACSPERTVSARGSRQGRNFHHLLMVSGGQAVACMLAEGGRVLLGHPRSVPSVRRALEAAVGTGGGGPPGHLKIPVGSFESAVASARAALARGGRVQDGNERQLLATLGMAQSTSQGGVLTPTARVLASADHVLVSVQKWGTQPVPRQRVLTVVGVAPAVGVMRVEEGSTSVHLEFPVDASLVKAWMSWVMFESEPSTGGVPVPMR